jgi:hypothetical protein
MTADNKTTLELLFPGEKSISALDLSSLIFDLNRIYVVALRFGNTDYGSARRFANFGRNSFRLAKDLQLDVGRIRFESPGLIELATASAEGASAIWLMAQVLEKITSWGLNRKKLILEVRKLEEDSHSSQPLLADNFWPQVSHIHSSKGFI